MFNADPGSDQAIEHVLHRLESRALTNTQNRATALLRGQRVMARMGDSFSLSYLCYAEPICQSIVGAATAVEEGVDLLLRTQPYLLICSEYLETGYAIHLLKRAKRNPPTCQLLILLVRETQAVVQEAMLAHADAVVFKSSLGTGQGDFIEALETLVEDGKYFPGEILRLGAAQAPTSQCRDRNQPRHFRGDRENLCGHRQRQAGRK